MSATKIDWHPYPKEKPRTHEYCYVTIETLGRKKERFVSIDFLVYFFRFYWARHEFCKVIAWAYYDESYELVEPYQPEGKA